METEKLYEQDPFLKEFSAAVLACTPEKGVYQVVLDRTAFYPEGGGQPADHGMIDGIPVTDVHERDGVIFHTCAAAVEIGSQIHGVLDWARRFDQMQQHSGEHILSGILCDRFHCDNVGFHMGADTVTIDYNTDLTWEQALSAESAANAVIYADRSVEIAFPSPAALSAMTYRSKKALTGRVRIVTFPDADCCACCGTHVLRAGQVGLVKILSCQKFREGVRLEIVCGQRAFAYLSAVYEQDRAIAQRLSAKPTETLSAVERLEEALAAAKNRQATLECQVFSHIAGEHAASKNAVLIRPDLSPDSARKLADAVARASGGLAAVFSGTDSRYAYAIVCCDGSELTPLVKCLNQALNGRGGGRGSFAQGSVMAAAAEITSFFQQQGAFSCDII